MKILVTGGTGFIGAHSVAAILRTGHTVRLLVRSPQRVTPALAPLGVSAEDVTAVVTGDVADAAAVTQALDGCDAVLHVA